MGKEEEKREKVVTGCQAGYFKGVLVSKQDITIVLFKGAPGLPAPARLYCILLWNA